MREKEVEAALVRIVKKHGGLALKFVSPGLAGVPDRLLLFPGGKAAFVEVKAPGKKPRPLQRRRMAQFHGMGFPVFVISHPDQLSEMLESLNGVRSVENREGGIG